MSEKLSKNLLHDLEKKAINLHELNEECVSWLLNVDSVYNDLIPRYFPSKTPMVIEYEEIPDNDKKRLNKDYFTENPDILDYYDKRFNYFSYNFFRLEWLKKARDYCATKEMALKLENKIKIFLQTVIKQAKELKISNFDGVQLFHENNTFFDIA
jgi:hypothetical protein